MGLAPRWRLAALLGLVPTALLVIPLTTRSAKAPEGGHVRPGVARAGASVPAAAPHTCAGPAPAAANAAFEARVVELVNGERRAVGLPPLKRVEPLTSSARWFAREMATEDYFSRDHDTYYREQGRLVRACAWSARLGFFYPTWTALAENIAAGYDTPEKVVAGWMGSPEHRSKILGHGHWETGAGYWAGGSEDHYWVEDFGRRGGAFPVVIDDEAPTTSNARVSVYVYGTWREMRVRNDDGSFGPWRTFANQFEWTLEDRPGRHQVTVELRDGSRSASSSDSITLAGQPPT